MRAEIYFDCPTISTPCTPSIDAVDNAHPFADVTRQFRCRVLLHSSFKSGPVVCIATGEQSRHGMDRRRGAAGLEWAGKDSGTAGECHPQAPGTNRQTNHPFTATKLHADFHPAHLWMDALSVVFPGPLSGTSFGCRCGMSICSPVLYQILTISS